MSASAAGAPAASATRLPRQVKLFGAVSLLNDFASEMIYPLLPALVTGVLGAGPQALGALDGAADFAAAFVKLGAGRLADRPAHRGRLVVLGYAVAVLVRPVIAFAAAAWQVIGLRVVDRLGKGLRTPPRDALIADPLRAVVQAGDVGASGEQVRQLEEMELDERAELVMGVVREVHRRGGQARFGAIREDGRIGGPD